MPSVTTRRARSGAVLALLALVVAAGTACGSGSSGGTTATSSTSTGPAGEAATTTDAVAQLGVEVLATHPHDQDAYTQGLVYAGPDRLYETTGLYGHSSLREVTISSGTVTTQLDFEDRFFGEGLALSNGRLVALTWREHTAMAFDPATFATLATFDYDTEGWGLCDDGARLIMSDGSATLTFRDQDTFAATGTVDVTLDGKPVDQLNELECVDGLVYANVYLTDRIVVIDPAGGRVVAEIDASGLLPPTALAQLDAGEVLNGIAYDPGRDVFYLTGKHWASLFEVRFLPRS